MHLISKRTILITGINGFVGQYIAKAMLETECKIIGIDLDDKCKLVHSDIFYLKVDITDLAQIDNVLNDTKIDSVIHLAALVHNKGKDLSLDNFMNINYKGAYNLIECALKRGAKSILFASTIEVYGEPRESIVDEETSCLPESYYGQSKLKAEKEITKLAKNHGASYGIMRLAPVYASDFKLNLDKRIYLPKKIAAYYFDDGSYSYNFCSIHNITDFAVNFLQSETETQSGVYIISDKENIKAIDLIKMEKRHGNVRLVVKLPYSLTKLLIGTFEWFFRRVSSQEPYLSLYNFRKLFKSTKFSSEKLEDALGEISWDYKNTLYGSRVEDV